jgi:hypothetical protein
MYWFIYLFFFQIKNNKYHTIFDKEKLSKKINSTLAIQDEKLKGSKSADLQHHPILLNRNPLCTFRCNDKFD